MSLIGFLLRLVGSALAGALAAPVVLYAAVVADPRTRVGELEEVLQVSLLTAFYAAMMAVPVTLIAGVLAATANRDRVFDRWPVAVGLGLVGGLIAGLSFAPVPLLALIGGVSGAVTGLVLWRSRATGYSFARRTEAV